MNRIFTLLLITAIATPFIHVQAQESTTTQNDGTDTMLCSDIFPAGSVTATFVDPTELDQTNVDRGDSKDLSIVVTNDSSVSITNTTVHLRLYRVEDGKDQTKEFELYKTETVESGLTLQADSVQELTHSFSVPTYLSNGYYFLTTYVESHDRFPVTNADPLQVDEDHSIRFAVGEGNAYGPTINRSTVTVNDLPYSASGQESMSAFTSSNLVNGIETTSINLTVQNEPGAGAAIGRFTWEVYAGEVPNSVTQIDSRDMPIKLVPNTQTKVTYQLLDPAPVDYTIVGTLQTGDNEDQSIMISLGEDDSVTARPNLIDPIDFVAFAPNPDDSAMTDVSFCYTPADIWQYNKPTLSLSIANTTGVVGEYTVIPTDNSRSKVPKAGQFSFPSQPGEYTLTATLQSADAVISSSSLDYTQVAPEPTPNNQAPARELDVRLIAIVAVVVALLIYGLVLYRRSFYKPTN